MSRPKSNERIRAEARAWVLRLQDSHTSADREAFRYWLAEDPAHRAAYDGVAASFESSGVLRASEIGRRRNLQSVFPKRNPAFDRSVVFASIAGLLLVGGYELSHGYNGLQPVALESVMLSTGAEGQNVTLADGSRVSLTPASEVRIDLGRRERRAEVRRGRVRLSVAREWRPFLIVAGASSAETTAGIFDAAIVGGQGTITAATVHGTANATLGSELSQASTTGPSPARQTIEFNAEPLGHAIERINLVGAGPRIEIDPALAGLRVTGVFQQGDSQTIARSVALAFGLKLTSTASGELLLTR